MAVEFSDTFQLILTMTDYNADNIDNTQLKETEKTDDTQLWTGDHPDFQAFRKQHGLPEPSDKFPIERRLLPYKRPTVGPFVPLEDEPLSLTPAACIVNSIAKAAAATFRRDHRFNQTRFLPYKCPKVTKSNNGHPAP